MSRFFDKYFTIFICCYLSLNQVIAQTRTSYLNRYNGLSLSSQELQKSQQLKEESTPYPAAGFHPRQQFNLPQENPLFPLATQQFVRNSNQNNGNIKYRNDFNVDNDYEGFTNGQPKLLYGAPLNVIQGSSRGIQRSFANEPSPLRSQYQLRDSTFKPERLTFNQENGLEKLTRMQNDRFKPARLVNNREEREEREDDDYEDFGTSTDIEVDSNKRGGNKKTNDVGAAPALVTYYPASAIGFVQPLTSTSYPLNTALLNPSASVYQRQPIVYSASGRPLQTW